MTDGRPSSSPYRPIIIGAISGGLLCLSLPKPDLYPLAWIALVPWLVVLAGAQTWRRAAATSYSAGVVFFGGTFYWITETMTIYGGLNLAESIGVGLLFTLAFALYFTIFGVLVYAAVRRWGLAGLLTAAPIWVAIELARTYLISGFPWMLSGYALVPFSGVLQVVTWTGVYGLSFIATAVNSGIAIGIYNRSSNWLVVSVASAVVLSVFPILSANPDTEDPIEVRLVQTNIALDQPWQEPDASILLDQLAALSSNPGQEKLIVWPETPAPFYLSESSFRRRVENMAHKADAYVLIGYIDRIGESPTNSAALVAPDGKVVSRYDKMHLVPFGEYVPLKNLLFFAKHLTEQVGDFVPGTRYTISPIDNHTFSTAICYESIFPNLVREFVNRGSQLIVVITDDGWFGVSSAPYQHLRMGVVRAVENRRWEVRTANTGISAIIDPYGRIVSRTPMEQRMILDGTAHFRSDVTFYTKHGDIFAYLNVVAAIAIAFATGLRRSPPPERGGVARSAGVVSINESRMRKF